MGIRNEPGPGSISFVKEKSVSEASAYNRCGYGSGAFLMLCVQRSWTTLAGVSPVTVIASEPCS